VSELSHAELNQNYKVILDLWEDAGIQKTFQRANEFQLPSSWLYWIENLNRISDLTYIPTPQDLFHIRTPTTGISETNFKIDDIPIRMVDVGGQRSERKKWIHCFEDVTGIIFIIAINEYNMLLLEDENVNRMHESLNLFKDICNEKWLKNIPLIVFLNKSDLFKEKIKKVDLKVCFPEYEGGCDYDKAIEFIVGKLFSFRGKDQRPFYYHVTCATDTKNVQYVFNACKSILLKNVMSDLFENTSKGTHF